MLHGRAILDMQIGVLYAFTSTAASNGSTLRGFPRSRPARATHVLPADFLGLVLEQLLLSRGRLSS